MLEVTFLIALAIVWMSFGSVQDLKKREISNWLNFSLIIFALSFRFFYSLFAENFLFFYQGLIGLGVFFIIGNLFYYSRLFAGGDAKLMISLGTILGFSNSFFQNLKIFVLFLLIFLFVGGIYGGVWSLILSVKNSKRFLEQYKRLFFKNKKTINLISIIGLLILLFGFVDIFFLILGIFIFIFSPLYIYAKAVDESCMIKEISPKELTEGDWLYKSIKINNKIINSKWEGLNKKEIQILRKLNKKILIRNGIAFVPVFLISFLILIFIWFKIIL